MLLFAIYPVKTDLYCANCFHCKLTTIKDKNGKKLRVKCSAGKWKDKKGKEKLYRYDTVLRRRLAECDNYESMGEVQDFVKQLRDSLPATDNVYE